MEESQVEWCSQSGSNGNDHYSIASLEGEKFIQPTQSIDETDPSVILNSPRGFGSSVLSASQSPPLLVIIPNLDEPGSSSGPKSVQTIPGTRPSALQKPEYRLRRESHPFYHAPIATRTQITPTICTACSSYNQFWPYILSPRRHVVYITTPMEGEDTGSKAYLYRNRYPTLLTLSLLAASFFPFVVMLTLLLSCYNAGKNVSSTSPIQCTVRNQLTPLLPLSFWVVSSWACIWAFRERVVIFWLSAEQDPYTYEYEWRFTLAKRGLIFTSWGGFQGPIVEELYNEDMSRPDIQFLRHPIVTVPNNTEPQPVIHWSDLNNQINPNTATEQHGIPYTPELPKARNRNHPAYLPPNEPNGVLLEDLDFQENEEYLNPDAPGLTQEEKMKRWREMRRRQLYLGLTMTNSNDNPLVESSSNRERAGVVEPAGNKLKEEARGDETEGRPNWGGWLSSFSKDGREETNGGQSQGSSVSGSGKVKGKGKGKAGKEDTIPERQFDISGPIF